MNTEARELDQLVEQLWLQNHGDKLFERVLTRFLNCKPTNIVPLSRAMEMVEREKTGPVMQRRIDAVRSKIEALRLRELQADSLGDLQNEPQALFSLLKPEEVQSIQGFDAEALRRARLSHQESRGRAALAFFETLGWSRLSPEVADELRLAIDDLVERESYQAWGLFVSNDGHGLALGLKLVLRDAGQELFSDADPQMKEQARLAVRLALQGQPQEWDAKIEWPAHFAGESLGLPLYIAALVANRLLPGHALTAATGRLDIDGRVIGVTGITAKISAARRIGVRKVLVPGENLREAKAAAGEDLAVLGVDDVREVLDALRQPVSAVELGYGALNLLIRASIPDYQLALKEEVDSAQGRRFVVANASGNAQIWVYRNGRVRADGPAGPALQSAARLVLERVPPEPEQRQPLTVQLPTRELQQQFESALRDVGATNEEAHQYESWRIRLLKGRSRTTVVLYNSGKCVIQGTAPTWDDAKTIADTVTRSIGGIPTPEKAASKHSDSRPPSEQFEPHIGTDEAGKGDYFGPLVSAAVFVHSESAAKLQKMGVRDSKTLSDKRVRDLADQIRRMPEVRTAVTPIYPRRFNDLYEQFRREGKNLNSLLAWGHAKSIDILLSSPDAQHSKARYVIVDQFADKHYIQERTRKAGIPVHQRHKAEEDIAVAAASVLARDAFLRWLEQWSARTQVTLPKGASPQVIEAAKQFVRRWGAKWLREVAKLNFRTTAQVLDGEHDDTSKRAPDWVIDGTHSR